MCCVVFVSEFRSVLRCRVKILCLAIEIGRWFLLGLLAGFRKILELRDSRETKPRTKTKDVLSVSMSHLVEILRCPSVLSVPRPVIHRGPPSAHFSVASSPSEKCRQRKYLRSKGQPTNTMPGRRTKRKQHTTKQQYRLRIYNPPWCSTLLLIISIPLFYI
jgi:hypothetical protein